jgi:malonyl-CoA/methylmalonyl-CoA synthetase
MTEIGMALSNPLHGERRFGSVGIPLPGVEIRLINEQGESVSQEGIPGEISVRGETVFKEYWRKKEITRRSFRNGWFETGDVAVVENGYFRILGRSSVDIIKTGGYKISALETEEVLLRHSNIRECAVVGVEDEVWGERVSAVVVLRPGLTLEIDQLRQWAADKLVNYKIPSQIIVLEELPRNAMGKVKKTELRDLFQ